MENKMYIHVETNLDEVNADLIDVQETIEEIVELAEEIAELEKEKSVFKCDIQGMKFEGTKSDFEAFIQGVVYMAKAIGLK
jgi:archaellum component FlaC